MTITETLSEPPTLSDDGAGALSGEAKTPAPLVIGLDLSLTSTGLASPSGTDTIATVGHKDATWTQRQNRLHHIRNLVLLWCKGADLIVVEGPSYGSVGGSAHDRAGLWWLVVDRLIANQIPVAVMTPTQRAMYATGKGNAAKDACMLAASCRWGRHFDITGNDTADAVTLCAAGLDYLGYPPVVMPDTHRRALATVAWPELVSD